MTDNWVERHLDHEHNADERCVFKCRMKSLSTGNEFELSGHFYLEVDASLMITVDEVPGHSHLSMYEIVGQVATHMYNRNQKDMEALGANDPVD